MSAAKTAEALSAETLAGLLKRSGEFQRVVKTPPQRKIAVPKTLSQAEPIPFRRYLKKRLREGAFAYVWSDGEFLNFLGAMEDSDPHSFAAPVNDRTWKKGDVMEFFLQPAGSVPYYEMHIAPNGATVQLRIGSFEEFWANKGDTTVFQTRFFDCEARASFKLFDGEPFKGWAGLISLPVNGKLLGGSFEGAKISVCRYNYNRAWKKPELSSTTQYGEEKPTFHNMANWPSLENSKF